jgi:hypothetical protein
MIKLAITVTMNSQNVRPEMLTFSNETPSRTLVGRSLQMASELAGPQTVLQTLSLL